MNNKKNTIQYDIIIIGGGIAGIYIMHELSKSHPDLSLLLLEKNKQFGGRVDTGHFGDSIIEKGAGRFSGSHTLLLQLIDELSLKHKIQLIGSNAFYMPAKGQGIVEKSVFDAPSYGTTPSFLENLYNHILNPIIGPDIMPSAGLIAQVILRSKMVSKETLQKQTFLQFANTILHKKQTEYIENAFGYYSELHIMNAYDCIRLMTELSPTQSFYSIKDGFSQIIFRMLENLQKNKHHMILSEQTVTRILPQESWFRVFVDSDVGGSPKYYIGKQVICALPKQSLEKISIFKPIRSYLSKVNAGSLCRIYSQFDVKKGGGVWFNHLPKFTTNNRLRMVIPINAEKGIIMISYTDNMFADYWEKIYRSEGIDSVNQKIKELILESTGIDIPKPKNTQLFYWKHGVGYWGVGADSEKVAERLIQPFESMKLYICGENYSADHQQWIEGALETSREVLDKMVIE